MKYDITVIIVNWKVRHLVEQCLDSILSNKEDFNIEIIVVDNDSSDGISEMIMMQYPFVKMIALSSNQGFAKANNLGIKRAKGEFIFLLNPDTKITKGFFSKTVSYLRKNTDIGILGPHILNSDGSLQPSVRRSPDLISQILILLKLKNILVNNKYLNRYLFKDFDYNKEQIVEQIMGAAMIIRHSLIKKLGLLDESFFLWFEEVDYCKRAKDKNIRIKYLPEAKIIHYGGSSFGQQKTLKKQLMFNKSLLHYFYKHKPVWQWLILVLTLPINIILTIFYVILKK